VGALRAGLALACALSVAAPAGAIVIGNDVDPVPTPTRELVEMQWSGGIGGMAGYVVVGVHGSAFAQEDSGRRRFRVSARKLARLREALRGADFAHLRTYYPARVPVADGFQYVVLYKGHYVQTEDGAAPPTPFRRVLNLLRTLSGPSGPGSWSELR
jgi:hypothetical protein